MVTAPILAALLTLAATANGKILIKIQKIFFSQLQPKPQFQQCYAPLALKVYNFSTLYRHCHHIADDEKKYCLQSNDN